MKAKKVLSFLVFLITIPLCSQTFNNVGSQMGFNATYYVHNYIPGGGVAIGDLDNDGFPDVIIATADTAVGGGGIKVYHNNGGVSFTDITASTGINFVSSGLKCIIIGDFNNDGLRDVYITSWYSGNRLYKNNGNGTFTNITATAGVDVPNHYQSSVASWFDFNNDGYLDLYVANYGGIEGCGDEFNILFKNNGNGTFSDVTSAAGVADSSMKKPLAIVCFDYNYDGWQDIMIANDKGQRPTLFKNNGNSTFTDVTLTCGVMCICDGMGLTLGDINHSGNLSVYMSNNINGNFLFRNNGNGTFTNISGPSGIQMNKNCWGANFFDYDNEGWDGLFVTASLGIDMCDAYFKNNHNNTFTNVVSGVGLVDSCQSHGSAVCDFNNDGYPDLFVTEIDSNVHVYKNNGGTNHWIKFKCTGTISNKDAIGTSLTIYYAGTVHKKAILGGNSFLSCDDVVQLFGLGTATGIDSVRINWTNGMTETAYNLAADRIYYAVEGSGIIGIQNISSQVPKSFNLAQNYPNPFNPSTKIQFSLPENEFVNIKVYDITGREVTTLVNQNLRAGVYSTDFNGSNLSSGVYFYTIRTAGFAETKKMILTK